MKQASLCFLTLLFFSVSCYYVIVEHQPPRARGTDAPQTEFSSGRAMQHLKVIAQAPHPVGSAEHDRLRDYIVKTLSELGLRTEIQDVETTAPRSVAVVRIQNIMARLDGEEGRGRAITLVAHYDSVSQSYGAGDNGAGVAALLETLRALIADHPLKRDIVALFTDGEELGLIGAKAFVERSSWADGSGLFLNFDVRGSRYQ